MKQLRRKCRDFRIRIGIRVDASTGIGSGHIFRCINLAQTLKNTGMTPIFFMRGGENSLEEMVDGLGFQLYILGKNELTILESPFYLDIIKDADEFIEMAIKHSIDAVIVDHYGANADWESRVGKKFPVIAIDDFLERPHNSLLVVNPNYLNLEESEKFISSSPNSNCLHGSIFALVNPHSCFSGQLQSNQSELTPISVYFGASDPGGLTLKILKILLNDLQIQNPIHVVLGIFSEFKEEIRLLACQFKSVYIYDYVEDLGSIFSTAPIAIGAGGSTIWERLLFDNYVLAVATAENQISLAASLSRIGAINYLGEITSLSKEQLTTSIRSHIKSFDSFRSTAPRFTLDRDGTKRIVLLINVISGTEVTLNVRPITKTKGKLISDYEFALMWIDLLICKISISVSTDEVRLITYENEFTEILRKFDSSLIDVEITREIYSRFPNRYISFNSSIRASVVILIDKDSWLLNYLWRLVKIASELGFRLLVTHSLDSNHSSDICIVLGYKQILNAETRNRFRSVIVVHESPLPQGRGWSPMTWRVIEGYEEMCISLFQANDSVDSGEVYLEARIPLKGDELIEQLREIQASASIRLIQEFLSSFPEILNNGRKQVGEPSYYPRRGPSDSHCSVDVTIGEIFNLLRVSDPERYPVTFEQNGKKFILSIRRLEEFENSDYGA